MKTLYLECNMGAAGDMLMAALLELHRDPRDFLRRLNEAGIPDVEVAAEPSEKCGITGTRVSVKIGGHEEGLDSDCHKHGGHHNIERLISGLNVSDAVKNNASNIYKLIAEAESQVHGVPVDQIHFHELGAMDAVADIVGVCMLIQELEPDTILVSPVNVGGGSVRCQHGVLPVPAPATACILKNIPIYSELEVGELCTPTGAALLKYFANGFSKMPVMTVSGIGYGMGKRDFDKANCVRAYIGGSADAGEEILELVCNLDDMTPEAVAFAQQLLFDEGALDVCAAPIVMKKGRAGVSLSCMCRPCTRDKMLELIFKHTSTLGIREYAGVRYTLQREQAHLQTKYGAVKVKISRGFGIEKAKPEYEDIAKIARENQKSIQDILKDIRGGSSV